MHDVKNLFTQEKHGFTKLEYYLAQDEISVDVDLTFTVIPIKLIGRLFTILSVFVI